MGQNHSAIIIIESLSSKTPKVSEIAEKIKISNYANSGIYCFSNLNQLFHYSKLVTNDKNYYSLQLLTVWARFCS